MAWAGTGQQAATSVKASGATWTPSLSITSSANRIIFLGVTFDNTGTSTPTISSVTVPGGESAAWALYANHDSSSASSAGGVRGEIWAIETTAAWSSFSPLITLSAAVTAKDASYGVFSGGSLIVRGSAVSGTSTSGAPTATLNGASQPQVDDIIVLLTSAETDTGIAGEGTFATIANTVSTTGGGAASNATHFLQCKIVTVAGDVSLAPSSSGDSGLAAVVLQVAAVAATPPPILVMAPRAA